MESHAAPVHMPADDPDKAYIEKMFGPIFEQSGWGYVFNAEYSSEKGALPAFLCANWASWRALNKIPYDQKVTASTVGKFDPIETTDWKVSQRARLLNLMELGDKHGNKFKECTATDPDRSLIFWSVYNAANDGDTELLGKELIGHVSVKPFGREKWESKLSQDDWVILHDEYAFTEYKYGTTTLRPAVYYKENDE
ncbi:hypothetical protein AA313_de0205948 [Arthrobotrys entomopaga]|nr:hypothetical protein AA313_de0205948 [Arthrobotrys entomopaga]